MCVLGNYNVVAPVLGADYIAKNIIPSICPMLVDRSLDKKQFELVGNLMRTMLYQVYEMRANDLGLAGSGKNNVFDREHGGTELDPFYSAKVMIQNARKDSADSSYDVIPPSQQFSKVSQTHDTERHTNSSSAPKYNTQVSEVRDARLTKVSSKKSPTASQSTTSSAPVLMDSHQQSSGSLSAAITSSSSTRQQSVGQQTLNAFQQNTNPYATAYPSAIPQADPFFQSYPQPVAQPSYHGFPSTNHLNSGSMYATKAADTSLSSISAPSTAPYSGGMYSQAFNGDSSSGAYNGATTSSSKKSDDPFDFLS
jgi:hypothetical protein